MASTAKSLLEGLLTVEVDLIVTDQLVTRPSLEHPDDVDAAVEALIADYRRWIVDRAAVLAALDLGRLRDSPSAPATGDLPEIERVAQLGVGRCTALAAAGRLADPHMATVFHRIQGNAAQIRQISNVSPHTADQLALVRKAIELGTDVILTQTVVQADGDVVVRVDPTVLSGTFRSVAATADSAVEQTLAYWRSLVDLVCVVATTAGTGTAMHLQLRTVRRVVMGHWRAHRSTQPTTIVASARVGPIRTWTLLRTVGVALFSRGGATIESPPNGETPYARTVVQPDGDALWFIRDDALTDRVLIDQHTARVADWYDSTGSAITRARAYIVRLQQAASACLGIISVAGTSTRIGWWSIALGIGAAVAAPRLVRSGIGRLFRWRCHIRAW